MKKFIMLVLMCFVLSGCSLIPRMTFDTPNTLPQSTEKSKAKFKCSGKVIFNANGEVQSCSKGYYNYEELYNKQERKMTIVEKIKSMFNALVGSSFWIVLALIFLCPSLIGLVLGRLIEGTVGVTGKALRSTVTAISKAKKNGQNYTEELAKEHSKDKAVQKKINALRAEV